MGPALTHICASVKDTVCGSINCTCLSPSGTKWTTTAGHRDQRAVGVSFHLLGISAPIGEKYTCFYGCCVTLQEKYLPFSHRLHPSCLCCILRIPQGQRYMRHQRARERWGRHHPWVVFPKINMKLCLCTLSSVTVNGWAAPPLVDYSVCVRVWVYAYIHTHQFVWNKEHKNMLTCAREW